MTIEPMLPEDFAELATWRYEPPYDFYNGDVEPVLNPERFFVVRDDSGGMVGFFYFGQRGDVLEYGLGMRPDLTGRSLGSSSSAPASSSAASATARHSCACTSPRSTSARSRCTSAPAFARPAGTCARFHAGVRSSS